MHMARKGIKPTSIAPMVGLCMANSPLFTFGLLSIVHSQGTTKNPSYFETVFRMNASFSFEQVQNGANAIHDNSGYFLNITINI